MSTDFTTLVQDLAENIDWTWADSCFNGSDFADIFEVDDCEYDGEAGLWKYFDEKGNCIAVDQNGNVMIHDDTGGETIRYVDPVYWEGVTD